MVLSLLLLLSFFIIRIIKTPVDGIKMVGGLDQNIEIYVFLVWNIVYILNFVLYLYWSKKKYNFFSLSSLLEIFFEKLWERFIIFVM